MYTFDQSRKFLCDQNAIIKKHSDVRGTVEAMRLFFIIFLNLVRFVSMFLKLITIVP